MGEKSALLRRPLLSEEYILGEESKSSPSLGDKNEKRGTIQNSGSVGVFSTSSFPPLANTSCTGESYTIKNTPIDSNTRDANISNGKISRNVLGMSASTENNLIDDESIAKRASLERGFFKRLVKNMRKSHAKIPALFYEHEKVTQGEAAAAAAVYTGVPTALVVVKEKERVVLGEDGALGADKENVERDGVTVSVAVREGSSTFDLMSEYERAFIGNPDCPRNNKKEEGKRRKAGKKRKTSTRLSSLYSSAAEGRASFALREIERIFTGSCERSSFSSSSLSSPFLTKSSSCLESNFKCEKKLRSQSKLALTGLRDAGFAF